MGHQNANAEDNESAYYGRSHVDVLGPSNSGEHAQSKPFMNPKGFACRLMKMSNTAVWPMSAASRSYARSALAQGAFELFRPDSHFRFDSTFSARATASLSFSSLQVFRASATISEQLSMCSNARLASSR
jgi:hypothetical protein